MSRRLLDTTLVGETWSRQTTTGIGAPLLILGVGNLLMGDEGVGIHVIRELDSAALPEGVRLLDGGTGGVDLLDEIQSARTVIMIDATRDGRPAGTIGMLRPQKVGSLPQGLSAHEFGLKDLFAAATLLREMPNIHLFTVSVETVRPMCLELSPPVAAVVPLVAHTVRTLAAELAASARS